jgi:IS605 OrfB family transposase
MTYNVPMTQSLSVKCKLIVPVEYRPKIDETLQGFADACNSVLEVAKREKCWNTTKLHHKVYKPVRESTGLKANHVCQAIRRVISNAKAVKEIHKFRPTSISLDIRTFKYIESEQTVGVTLKSGRVNFKLSIGGYQMALLKGQSLTSAVLKKTKQGDYYINFVVETDTPPTGKTPKVIGVDLGQKDIAHTSTGKSWSGGQVQATRDHFAKVRASIQRKCSKGAKRLLRRLSGREQRFQKWVNHNISKQLVEQAKLNYAALAFEDLTGIRKTAKVRKSQRRNLHTWACYQLRMFTTYKAAIAGVPVLLIPAPYSSQTHYVCLRIGQRRGKDFWCECCQVHEDADSNASKVIELWGCVVSQPERSALLSCSLLSLIAS